VRSEEFPAATTLDCQVTPHEEGDIMISEHCFSSLILAKDSPNSRGHWLLDSGCSRHMTGDYTLFRKIKSLDISTFVKFGDGKRLQALGYGQVSTPIGVVEALYVPHLCANLLSVSQLNRSGAGVHFLPLPQKSEIRYNGQRFGVSLVGNIFQVDEACSYLSTQNELDLWHQKLGHLNYPAVVAYLKRFGTKISNPPNSFCRVCAEAKLSERKFQSRDESQMSAGKMHSDMGGPVECSHEGFMYWITFLMENSRYVKVAFLKKKSDAVEKIIQTIKSFQANKGCGISIFRSDGGGEYKSLKVQEFFADSGIEHEVTPRYTPQLNGMAERLNRTLIDRVRCLLLSSGLNTSFWKDAMEYAVYIYNRTPHSGINYQIPWEVFHNMKLQRLPKFHIFGSICYYHVPKELRTKLMTKGKKGLFLGFTNTSSLVLTLGEDKEIIEVRTAVVDEGEFLEPEELKKLGIGNSRNQAAIIPLSVQDLQPVQDENFKMDIDNVDNDDVDMDPRSNVDDEGDEDQDLSDFLDNTLERETRSNSDFGNPAGSSVGNDQASSSSSYSPNYVEDDIAWHPRFGRRYLYDQDDESWEDDASSDESTNFAEQVETLCFLSHLAGQDEGSEDKLILDKLISQVEKKLQCLSASSESANQSSTSSEPRNFLEAVQDPLWIKSMQQEMKSLLDNKTWILVDLPKGRKLVRNKWVYKVKSDGRLKSRLVAKGFTQVPGVDFEETFSPVGRKASLKMLIWLVMYRNWKWKQMDVDTAFLYSTLEEEIYMEQPKGYEDGTDRVCRLLKSIYGLKQASRAWYDTLKDFLEGVNMKRSRVDPCIYFGEGVIIFVYVDDIIIAGENDEIIEKISDGFKSRFKMKDLGEPKRILGLDLIEVPEGIMLCGKSMIEDLLRRTNMLNCRPVSTPMDPNQSFVPNPDKTEEESNRLSFASVIGSLLYIANSFRPDICYAVSVLSQFTSNPSEDHWRGAKRVLRYLSGTRDYGLLFKRRKDGEEAQLRGFTDADFASCFSRKSRTGYIFLIGDAVLCWHSRKQSVIALSTCEAEFYALTEGGKEAIHLKRLFWEICNQEPLRDEIKLETIKLFCDNQSTIFVSKNPAEHRMMKHVDLRYKWIQEKIDQDEFQVEYVSTKEQLADIFTKALAKELFEKFRARCGVVKHL
jgi:hypothetical protein